MSTTDFIFYSTDDCTGLAAAAFIAGSDGDNGYRQCHDTCQQEDPPGHFTWYAKSCNHFVHTHPGNRCGAYKCNGNQLFKSLFDSN